MVLYRKHRPQTLEELVGQVTVKQSLKSAVGSNKLAHAYLFYGPRGTGKTTTARIVAKIVNCESDDLSNRPCNTCPSCLSITNGSSLDVIEMDAASNRGIEDIRSLRENIKLAPTSSKKKIYIIDEVHMLSTDAFNALLKTLEEPPAHVMFVLATTEIHKIPQTILSRVQRLDFKQASTEELVEALNRVVKKEKIDVDQEALLLLAKRAGGSFRDGIKLLDQLSSRGKISLNVIADGLGFGIFEKQLELLEEIALGNSQKSLQNLLQQFETGISVKELTSSLLDVLRELLFIKNNVGEILVKGEVGEEKYKALKELASKFELGDLLFIIKSFEKSLEASRFVSITTLPLEVAVVESCYRGKLKSGEDKVEVQVDYDKKVKIESKEKRGQPIPQVAVFIEESGSGKEDNELPQGSSQDIQKIAERWTYILETVRQDNFSLEALLRSSRIVHCDKVGVVFEVPYAFHQRILEAPKARDLLESILSDILERQVKITTVLAKKQTNREELANVEVAADDEIVRIAAEIFNADSIN